MKYINNAAETFSKEGLIPLINKSVQCFSRPAWNTVTSRHPFGTNIFSKDWDLCIILDACRVDALRAVASEYPFIENIGEIWSVGSMSWEWAVNTFNRKYKEEISRTAYVCRNSLPHKILTDDYTNDSTPLTAGWPDWNPVASNDLAHHELVRSIGNLSEEGLHPQYGTVPHVAVDRAIAVGRQHSGRLLVHLNSPHLQFITGAIDWSPHSIPQGQLMNGPAPTRDLHNYEKSFEPAKQGEVNRKIMWDLYIDELRFILDYVDILLNNLNKKRAIITSDHGEALGEGGIWGHPYGWPHPIIRKVPWAVTSGKNKQTYQPKYSPLKQKESDRDHRKFLEQMGYL